MRAFLRVAYRCPYGRPAVTEQAPYAARRLALPDDVLPHVPARGRRRLAARGGRGVERWSALAAADPALRASVERATDEQRELRRSLAAGRVGRDEGASLELGIGGSSSPLRLKCLHAHVAFALARPGYALGERIVAELEQLFPEDGCCSL